jgi:transposase-like protein
MREVIRYSEAFKLRLVEDIGSGKYKSLDEARRRNGIRGGSTVKGWIKRYGREDMLPKRVKVETMNEIDELKAARRRIRELEAALSDAHMDYFLERAFLDLACEDLGVSREELRKKKRYAACRKAKETGANMKERMTVGLSSAVQKAVIKVDEKGTTAAAVTVMAGATSAGPDDEEKKPFTLICDKPFVFVLYGGTVDGGSQVLFTGLVNKPVAP